MALLIILVLALVLLEVLSLRTERNKIGYELKLPGGLVECDESVEMRTTLRNPGKLPVFYVKLAENVPEQMQIVREKESGGILGSSGLAGLAKLNDSFYLMGRQSLTRKLPVSFPQRGRYRFQSAEISTGDFLGLKELTRQVSCYCQVTVIPRKIEAPELNLALKNYMGDVSVRRFYMEDPILTVGFREYTGHEPMKSISWTQSARKNQLMVKEYDHTSEISAELILNTEGGSDADKEEAFSLARTVIDLLEEKRLRYSFRTNAVLTDAAGSWNYMPEGLGQEHRNRILSGLGSALLLSRGSLEKMLGAAAARHEALAGCILITVPLTKDQRNAVRTAEKRTGQKILVVEGGMHDDHH